MIIVYSKPRDRYETVAIGIANITQQKRAEWAATFNADAYRSVWLVPVPSADPLTPAACSDPI